jgi:hypothetical protein
MCGLEPKTLVIKHFIDEDIYYCISCCKKETRHVIDKDSKYDLQKCDDPVEYMFIDEDEKKQTLNDGEWLTDGEAEKKVESLLLKWDQ